MNAKILLSVAAVILALPLAGHAAERAKAKVDCQPAGEKYVYDCMIMLMGKKSGAPIEGAKVVVGADMPSMAMAHNIKPVTAKPMGKPGMYHARIHLQMDGEWALKMDVSGPLRDKIIHTMRFGTHEGEQGEMKHGDMKQGDMMKGDMKQGDMKHGEMKKE